MLGRASASAARKICTARRVSCRACAGRRNKKRTTGLEPATSSLGSSRKALAPAPFQCSLLANERFHEMTGGDEKWTRSARFCSYPCSYPAHPRLRDSFDDLAPVAQLEKEHSPPEATGRWFESRTGCLKFAAASYSAGARRSTANSSGWPPPSRPSPSGWAAVRDSDPGRSEWVDGGPAPTISPGRQGLAQPSPAT